MPRWTMLLVTSLALAACGQQPEASCRIGSPSVFATLFFGRSLHGGGKVDDAAWRDFLAGEVTPRFPDGLTVLDGTGQWRSRTTGRIGSEPSTLVVIVAEAGESTETRLADIRTAYRVRFDQESVGLVTERVCASF